MALATWGRWCLHLLVLAFYSLCVCTVAWNMHSAHDLLSRRVFHESRRTGLSVRMMGGDSGVKNNKVYCLLPGKLGSRDAQRRFPVFTVEELHNALQSRIKIEVIDVKGNSSGLDDRPPNDLHPVLQILHERARTNSKPLNRTDPYRVALAIEGGGMRGCVAGGMVSGLHQADTIDVIYGASAGSLVGAYFVSRQLPHYGLEVYYDMLTSAEKKFIDTRNMLRSMGLGLLDFRLENYADMIRDRLGKPVLNLDYLLTTLVQLRKPLDWGTFWENNKLQPLKVVASGLLSGKPVVLSAQQGNFRNLSELAHCIRASMLLPGIAGPVVRLQPHMTGSNVMKTWLNKYRGWKNQGLLYAGEPMADAVLMEPIPYRSALAENCTHVLVVRTRPDGVSCTKALSIPEILIAYRYFKRKHGLRDMVGYMIKQQHRVIYAEDILRLNAENKATNAQEGPKLMTVALDQSIPEISRLEMRREVVFEGVREGFARMYECVHPDPTQRVKGRGRERVPQHITGSFV